MTEIEVLTAALDEAGLIAVWLGKDKAQIVCKPGRFEHAKHALGLDDRSATIEECAKVADREWRTNYSSHSIGTAKRIAKSIRSLSQPKPGKE
jgi:hypothetical protein